MKVYVAAKFEKKELVLDIYKKLREFGHEISYDWTTHQNYKPYIENQEMGRTYSENELQGILDCDVFVYLSDEKGTTSLMEVGAALGLFKKTGKPLVYAVGKWNARSPWFFNSGILRRDTVEEVLEEIKDLK